MSEPTPPQPSGTFWEALPQIVGKLKNEFLLVTLGILILAVAIGLFAPGIVGSLGQGFFYLLVVLAWLAYLIGRLLDAWLKVRQTRPPARSGEPSTQADHGSTVSQGAGSISIGSAGRDVIITQVRDGAIAQGDGATALGAGATQVNTGGGAFIQGDVRVQGGDFVGRDRIEHHGPSPSASTASSPAQADGYNLIAVRDLLRDAFLPAELRRLFLYTSNPALRPLLDEFGVSDGLNTMVDTTIEYCRVRGLLPDLLREVERERPRQYARYANRLRT